MSGTTQPSNFDELLKSLGAVDDAATTLAKATPAAPAADDKAVAAAAAEAGANADPDADPEVDPEADPEADPEGKEFGKSLGADAAGNELVDATELVKSLMDRQEKTDDVLAKAMTSMVSALGKQNDLIKSLQSQVQSLGNQGRGRKTLVTVAEKPGVADVLAKSQGAADEEEGKITPSQLLAKSQAAYDAGKITGAQLNTVDVCLRNGWAIDPGILTKVATA